MLNAAILFTVVAFGLLLFHPRVLNARLWRATITPLASIIGSGFLVIGPILDVGFGAAAPFAMMALCVVAFLYGSAVRFNISVIAQGQPRPVFIERVETLASAVLAFAFVISVAYYLNLFGAFGVSLTALDDTFHARILTSAIFIVILAVGWTRGFSALERLEEVSVGVKLAIIMGLLLGLAVHFGGVAGEGKLVAAPATLSGWSALTLAFGLLVTVQGFETSRYLGADYDAQTRIRSMRLAQLLASVIYVAYIVLLTYSFAPGTLTLDETAIIQLMVLVAPILPVLLVAAALSAQFSAAVADTGGSGGLIAEITKNRVQPKVAYALLVAIGLLLTWVSNVFEIIAYASAAFAAYYALQAMIAALSAWHTGERRLLFLFVPLILLGIAMAGFGKPAH